MAKRIAAVLGFDWTRFYEEEPEEAGESAAAAEAESVEAAGITAEAADV